MNVVDSSAWLDYFADDPNADFFAPAIEDTEQLVVPTICLLEVFKVTARERGMDDALQAIALMKQGEVVDLDPSLAIQAARLGLELKLPLADSIVLATARWRAATVWTEDSHFEDLEDARYVPKQT